MREQFVEAVVQVIPVLLLAGVVQNRSAESLRAEQDAILQAPSGPPAGAPPDDRPLGEKIEFVRGSIPELERTLATRSSRYPKLRWIRVWMLVIGAWLITFVLPMLALIGELVGVSLLNQTHFTTVQEVVVTGGFFGALVYVGGPLAARFLSDGVGFTRQALSYPGTLDAATEELEMVIRELKTTVEEYDEMKARADRPAQLACDDATPSPMIRRLLTDVGDRLVRQWTTVRR